MHEHNRHAAQTTRKGCLHGTSQMRHIQRLHHIAMCAHALVGFNHFLVQQLGQHNAPIKQTRAVLVGNAQCVFETLRGDQQSGLAFAFKQSVGGHRGAHLHASHLCGGDGLVGLQAQQMAYACHRRIAVLLGVFRQQFVGDQLPVRPLGNDVGEGAATIDPKLPLGVNCHIGSMGRGHIAHRKSQGLTRKHCRKLMPIFRKNLFRFLEISQF